MTEFSIQIVYNGDVLANVVYASPTTGSGISVSCLMQVLLWHPEQVYTELIRLIKAVWLYRKFNKSAMSNIYLLGTQ